MQQAYPNGHREYLRWAGKFKKTFKRGTLYLVDGGSRRGVTVIRGLSVDPWRNQLERGYHLNCFVLASESKRYLRNVQQAEPMTFDLLAFYLCGRTLKKMPWEELYLYTWLPYQSGRFRAFISGEACVPVR